MYLSKKEQIFLGGILKIFYKKKGCERSIFLETVKYNFRSDDVLDAERKVNEGDLLRFSAFIDNVTSRSAIPPKILIPVRLEIYKKIKLNNKNFIVSDSFYNDYFKESFFKTIINTKLRGSHKESERDINILKDGVIDSTEKELVNSYIMHRSKKFVASEMHLMIKAINNIESPNKDSLIPKELFQKAGMLQLGMSLNLIAKIDTSKNFMDLNKEETKRLKYLAKNASKTSRLFEYCKLSELRWRHSNIELIEKIEKRGKRGK